MSKHYSWLPSKPKAFIIITTAIGITIGVLLILYAWQLPPFFINIVATNDAYVQSKTTLLSPQISGYITDVYVKDFEFVKKGQPLLQIDKRIFTQKVEEAKANVQSATSELEAYTQNYRLHEADIIEKQAQIEAAEANLKNAQAENNRVSTLVKRGSLSKRDYDNAKAQLLSAQATHTKTKAQYQKSLQEFEAFKTNKAMLEAGVKRTQALLELALIDLDNSLIKAPIDGKLGEILAHIGQFVSQESTLTYIVPKARWVIANIKETKMDKVAIGQKVVFSVDALNDAKFSGVVEEIAPATGSEFSPIKVNHATGNFIKIIQRIPVKIKIDPSNERLEDLRAGMSVVVEVHTK
ncbi:HlyD family secretion protein [uncultured Helicobacter sp.]|uniref:HlyD family secretion protein n=1 Tax=uncultured Helicobacter sp. TaxID=175537 RepID=UPI001C3B16C1|nr:HlyD family secretion protein [Candidatus Helicobacter avicola]